MPPDEPGLLEEFSEIVAASRSLIEADLARGVRGYSRLTRAQIRSAIAVSANSEELSPASRVEGLREDPPEQTVQTQSVMREGEGTQVVLESPERPRVLVVGGVCSAMEEERGQPFLGEGGAMLEKMLKHVLGLERSGTALVMLRADSEGSDAYGRELSALVASLEPRMILGMGTVAVEALASGTESGTPALGKWGLFEGRPAMSTWDPEHLLAQPADKRQVFAHLKLFRQKMEAMGVM
ncbi:MAG: uracil-DNA glycosylase family protein [Myxococcota bacterium]|nr:uracil-DNA glycosylase family protein [Myxococcota bacterium]